MRRALLDRYGIEIGAGVGSAGREGVADRVHGPHGAAAQRGAAPGRARERYWDGDGPHRAGHARSSSCGRRITLRTLTEEDYPGWFEVRARCRDWLVPWEPRPEAAPRCRPRTGPASWPAAPSASASAQMGTGYGFGIFVEAAASPARSRLSSIQRGPFQSGFVGYWVDRGHGRPGLVPEAGGR